MCRPLPRSGPVAEHPIRGQSAHSSPAGLVGVTGLARPFAENLRQEVDRLLNADFELIEEAKKAATGLGAGLPSPAAAAGQPGHRLRRTHRRPPC